jgi:putative oxidoreductase
LIGGALIIVGLFTRPIAFIMAGFTAVAYFMVHAPRSFFPIVNGGELAAVYCFVFLYLVFAGAGPLSLDAVLRKNG